MKGLLSVEQFDAFLVPLSEESPGGEYLKSNRELYRPLRNAYNIAQTSLQKLSLNPDPTELDILEIENRENWLQLRTLLLEVLEKSSRDLECLAWLAMAQLFTSRPFAQLALVIQLIDLCINQFGEQIQPFLPVEKLRSADPDNAGMERAEVQGRALKLLFGESEDSCQIAVPLRMLPLVSDIDYVCYQHEEASRNELKQKVKIAFSSSQQNDTDDINVVVTQINDIQDVLDGLDALDKTLIEHFKKINMPAPGSRFLRQALEANLQAIADLTEGLITPWPPDVRKAARDNHGITDFPRDTAEPDASVQETVVQNETGNAGEQQAAGTDPSFNRNQAFQQLRLLSDYFQRTEPQSPVSYLLEKAIRWGYTPLPELMNELLQDNNNLMGRIMELTGMNTSHQVPIPGPGVAGLSHIPAVLTETLAPEQAAAEPEPPTSPPDYADNVSRQQEVITELVPSVSDPPGGLNISNLDDLV